MSTYTIWSMVGGNLHLSSGTSSPRDEYGNHLSGTAYPRYISAEVLKHLPVCGDAL